MEFKALKNIESSFRQIRLYAIIFLGCCMPELDAGALTGFTTKPAC